MQKIAIENVRIAGVCACVPKNAVRNEAKVAEATGIVTRRIAAEGTTVVDLCVKAAEWGCVPSSATRRPAWS